MSTGTQPTDNLDITVEDDDATQTLLSISLPGVDGVLAIDHGADLHDVVDALHDAPKEIKHRAWVTGRDAEFNGGDGR